MNTKSKIFVITSLLFILGCVGFFGYRLVHYYQIENPKGEPSKYNKLYDTLLLKFDSVSGLYKSGDTYYFKGEVNNNYVLYSGRLWRIVSTDEEQNVKIIAEDSQTILAYGDSYKKSYIQKWLNPSLEDTAKKSFYDTLDNEHLIYTTIYTDVVDDVNSIDRKKVFDDLVGILSLYEYNKAGGKTSYLNNDSEWWLSTTTSNGEAWYVLKDNIAKTDYSTFANKGVRPVVTLNYDTVITGGIGTKDKPFKVEEREINSLIDLHSGEKIEYSNYVWTVKNQEEGKTILVMDGYIKDVNLPFSASTNIYDPSDKTGIAYYLNNTFYNSLENKENLVENTFYNGSYGVEFNYDYENIKNSEISCYVGILSVGDLFSSQYPDVFLMNHSSGTISTYTISSDFIIYEDEIKIKKQIRPVIALNNSLEITSGDGYTVPYVTGGVVSEQQ